MKQRKSDKYDYNNLTKDTPPQKTHTHNSNNRENSKSQTERRYLQDMKLTKDSG